MVTLGDPEDLKVGHVQFQLSKEKIKKNILGAWRYTLHS